MYRTDGYRKHEGGPRVELEAHLEIDDYLPSYRHQPRLSSHYDAAFPGEAQIKHEYLDYPLRQARRPPARAHQCRHLGARRQWRARNRR